MNAAICCALLFGPAATAAWVPHTVRRLDGAGRHFDIPAELQIITESWNRVVAVPYMVYLPEKGRLLMLVACDYPHRPMLMTSNDRGATWTEPKPLRDHQGKSGQGVFTGLTYFGQGEIAAVAGDGGGTRWFSHDYGATWESRPLDPMPSGKLWLVWDPLLVERDKTGAVARLVETGYGMDYTAYQSAAGGYSQGYLRFSTDRGRTWTKGVPVPQWKNASEIALLRAANGNLVAACRTDIPPKFKGKMLDHYEGLGVCVSKDDGRTWSNIATLFDHGRHHPSMVLMPDGQIVMTYVVRKGYPDTADGYPQFGIEAITSRDNGQSWDLDHRYVLHSWIGNRKRVDPNADEYKPGPQPWWASCQCTSTLLLPDGVLLTAFGTGYRSQPDANNLPKPRDIGLIRWRPASSRRPLRED